MARTYQYDGMTGGTGTGLGNPTAFQVTLRAYNADNQDSAGVYDDNGNPSGSSLNNPGDGLRARTRYLGLQGSVVQTYFLYDGSQPVCEMNSSGSLTAVNDFGADGVWARHTLSSHAKESWCFVPT